MNRLLRSVCLCSATLLAFSACGDDEGGDTSASLADGGSLPEAIENLSDKVELLGDGLDSLGDDVEGLRGKVDELEGKLDETTSDLDDRLKELEEPDSCSVSESCIPDGVDLVTMGVASIIERICHLEMDCCSEDELRYKFGPGITDADECVAAFQGLVNNGFVPEFLTGAELGGGLSYGNDWLVRNVVRIAQALNNKALNFEIDEEGVEACLEQLEQRECPKYVDVDPEDIEPECNPDLEEPEMPACALHELLNGLQREGELCGRTSLPECEDGLICRYVSESCYGYPGEADCGGICAAPAEEGDPCTRDLECDPEYTDLFCNRSEGVCQVRSDAGEDCAYVNLDAPPSLVGMDPDFIGYGYTALQNPEAMAIECKRGLSCDPDTNTCVGRCDEGFLCTPFNQATTCAEGLVCNITENAALRAWGLGLCRPALQKDDPCTQDSECESNRCDGTCADVQKDDGETCTLATAGTPQFDSTCKSGYCTAAAKCATRCAQQSDCDEDSYCNLAVFIDSSHPDGAYACAAKKANTASCNPGAVNSADPNDNYECTSGHCDLSTAECADKVGLTEACSTTPACAAGQYCATTCTDMLGIGEACSPAGVLCEFGLACVADEEAVTTCQKPGEYPNGTTCSTPVTVPSGVTYAYDTLCKSGWCAGSATCAELLEEGDECNTAVSTMSRCEPGLYCDHPADDTEGTCEPQHTVGQDCNPRFNGADCLNNNGVVSACVNRSDSFVCDYRSIEAETLFCDGE